MTARKNWMMALTLALFVAAPVTHAQVGKSQGVVDANTAPEADLAKMPHMDAAKAKALVGVRPFKSITDLNTFLIGQDGKIKRVWREVTPKEHAKELLDAAGVSSAAEPAAPKAG